MKKPFKNKKVLITCGPTWVALDKVRVITNIFSGALGILIAECLYREGADITLLVGPVRADMPKQKSHLRIKRFRYYDDLLQLVKRELRTGKYDIMVHSAAVSDYKPMDVKVNKIKSGRKKLTINFAPTKKIVDLVKKAAPNIFLVKFKLEVNLTKRELLTRAYKSLKQSNADLIVANDYKTVIAEHRAYVIDKHRSVWAFVGKKNIAKGVVSMISRKLMQ